jgi:hypothetical protein
MQLAPRALFLLFAAVTTVACARQCGGLGGGPPLNLPEVVGPDGVKRHLLDKGAYKAWYDKWGRLEKIEYDKNGDGNPDHLAHYQGGRTAKLLEVDEDYNGSMDRWEYYDDAGALTKVGRARDGRSPDTWSYPGPGETARRLEYDDDHDGQVERAEVLEEGRVAGVELDADRDGKTDRWQRWVRGKMRGEELDTDGDGKADRRLAYDEKGNILGVQKIE